MKLHSSETADDTRKVKLAYLVSHPIQYQAPLLRRISEEPDIDLTVFFGSSFSVREYTDKGFGVGVKWDVSLLHGYRYEFLPTIRDGQRTGMTCPMNYGILSRLRGNGRKPRFDALWVHGYSTVNAMHAILAAKSLGIPVLLRAESWLKDRKRSGRKLAVKRLFFKGLGELVDGAMPIGTLNAAYWRHYLGDDFPLFPFPYAVDNDYFQRRSREARDGRAKLLEELQLEPGRPVILFASKLQSRKRCGDLLEAYRNLTIGPSHKAPPYLVIVGDGQERAELESRAKASGLDGVRFCGFRNQSELPGFFDLATVFVLPSRHEPWGLIVNEVMNAGRAVIVSDDVGCQPDLVTDGVEGCVFRAGDVTSLTDALRRVLATPETAMRMGERGLERIRTWSFEEDIRGVRQALAEVTRKITA
ncbi:glycosyltransferase involved in cell wall biosynthesis [Edaphobacter aggregans]|uniref:Glycosyltransferase involved in cell wall biosynthesis n=1 Tax=Edaphobacter aggregans TaxID=570835 RepID=A0A428MDV7_9BACT|nr:glycosyltransferase family 4 protein [Edaphobacter aggregans]RSL15056.1 glycosyltransferase involved in cell wall biosynthesis [Edaphobacter aggregans]